MAKKEISSPLVETHVYLYMCVKLNLTVLHVESIHDKSFCISQFYGNLSLTFVKRSWNIACLCVFCFSIVSTLHIMGGELVLIDVLIKFSFTHRPLISKKKKKRKKKNPSWSGVWYCTSTGINKNSDIKIKQYTRTYKKRQTIGAHFLLVRTPLQETHVTPLTQPVLDITPDHSRSLILGDIKYIGYVNSF